MDLILCRNVLIYFDQDTIRAVACRLFDALAPGGWLFTASSDPPLFGDAPFESVVTPGGVFYRRRPRAAQPAAGWAPALSVVPQVSASDPTDLQPRVPEAAASRPRPDRVATSRSARRGPRRGAGCRPRGQGAR